MSDSQREPRQFWVGTAPAVRAALEAGLGKTLEVGMPLDPHPGDVVFIEVFADLGSLAAVPGGNAFAACRALKEDPRVRVFTVLREADPYSAEIARFCLADGSHLTGARLAHLLGQEVKRDHEVTYISKEGRHIPISLSGSAMRDGDDNVFGYVCIGTDITERKRSDTEREELQRKLVSTSRQAGRRSRRWSPTTR